MTSDIQGSFVETASHVASDPKQVTSAVSTSHYGNEHIKICESPFVKTRFSCMHSARCALLISVLIAAGSYSILPIWLLMFSIWFYDPLRTIGAVFPLIAFAGTLVAWRRLGWSTSGTFWGLPLVVLSILIARITTSVILLFRFQELHQVVLHPGMVMFLYGVGAVLLFGGTPLLRFALAPLCLLLFIDPVPHFFNAVIDLPLQYLSATTARQFAHLIGLQPSGEQLRIMFSPSLGMMIVPGCNGIRGSLTFGYLTLIFGYIRHVRASYLALATLGAFLIGYALNLLRLCLLVVYYRFALTFPSIQSYGTGVDYTIGCIIFLFAAMALRLFIRQIEPTVLAAIKYDAPAEVTNSASSTTRSRYALAARILCFLILTLISIMPKHGKGDSLRFKRPSEQAFLSSFPAQVGAYRLVHSYTEHDSSGLVNYVMADYAAPSTATVPVRNLTFGIYVGLNLHMVSYSRFAHGVLPDSTGSFDAYDAGPPQPLPVRFATTLYDDGIDRQYNAETICYDNGCSATINSVSSQKRLFFVLPKLSKVVLRSDGNRLLILLRREWPDSDTTPSPAHQAEFESDVRQFISQLNLRELLHADGVSASF